MNRRYLQERDLLSLREGDSIEVTQLGGPVEFIECGPSSNDYMALARRAYLRGDLTVGEFEAEIERLMVLR